MLELEGALEEGRRSSIAAIDELSKRIREGGPAADPSLSEPETSASSQSLPAPPLTASPATVAATRAPQQHGKESESMKAMRGGQHRVEKLGPITAGSPPGSSKDVPESGEVDEDEDDGPRSTGVISVPSGAKGDAKLIPKDVEGTAEMLAVAWAVESAVGSQGAIVAAVEGGVGREGGVVALTRDRLWYAAPASRKVEYVYLDAVKTVTGSKSGRMHVMGQGETVLLEGPSIQSLRGSSGGHGLGSFLEQVKRGVNSERKRRRAEGRGTSTRRSGSPSKIGAVKGRVGAKAMASGSKGKVEGVSRGETGGVDVQRGDDYDTGKHMVDGKKEENRGQGTGERQRVDAVESEGESNGKGERSSAGPSMGKQSSLVGTEGVNSVVREFVCALEGLESLEGEKIPSEWKAKMAMLAELDR